MSSTVTWEANGVVVRFTGNVVGSEFAETNEAIYADGRADALRYALFDFSDAGDVAADRLDVEFAAATSRGMALSNRRMKVALVANHGRRCELIDEFLALSAEIGNPWHMRSFRDFAQAHRWVESP